MISVCIPTYNGEKYIKKQLCTILIQLSEKDEVIISDDLSTDNTLKIIEDFNDNRIKVFKGNTFKSPIFNLENALIKAEGEFIFLADQDDVWYSGKVSLMMESLKNNDLVLSDFNIIDEDDNKKTDIIYSRKKYPRGFLSNLYQNPFRGACIAFKRELLTYMLPFPARIPMHDIWIGLVAQTFGKVGYINKPLTGYRRHNDNASPMGVSPYSFFSKISSRIYILRNLIHRKFLKS